MSYVEGPNAEGPNAAGASPEDPVGRTGPEAVGAIGAAVLPGSAASKDSRLGLSVTHRRYVTYGDAHYGGNLVDGAYALALFGDVATEVCIRMDGDEGLFASYSDVQFPAPVQAGDIIEATAAVTAVGRRSRELTFEAAVVCRADPAQGPSAAAVLAEPLVVATATGTVVVPVRKSGSAK
jgi:3-aminobutyryl-CoA ammonia-lyase